MSQYVIVLPHIIYILEIIYVKNAIRNVRNVMDLKPTALNVESIGQVHHCVIVVQAIMRIWMKFALNVNRNVWIVRIHQIIA